EGIATYGNVLEEFTGIESLIGSDNNDTLRGDDGPNVLQGAEGDDIIQGFGGDDVLAGNDGNDQISGGNGDDLIEGGNGDDLLLGDAGNDDVFGDLGNDRIVGGGGLDLLSGGSGDDIINALPSLETINLFPLGSLAEAFTVEASDQPTGIAFFVTANTTLRLATTGEVNTADPGFSILDNSFRQVSLLVDGVQVAPLGGGQSFVLLFEPSPVSRVFSLESSAGPDVVQLGIGNLNNAQLSTDVNGDGDTSASDALRVINALSQSTTVASAQTVAQQLGTPNLVDVNNDGNVSALDALLIINELSRRAAGLAERETIAEVVESTLTPGVVNEREDELPPEVLSENPQQISSFADPSTAPSTNPTSVPEQTPSEQDSDDDRVNAVDAVFAEMGSLL
ncbi:MAG: dockerin type I domain-containing protein, partial [Pirellulales bacterium]|nr:dockerin type I domain-containing protein [Pirellulales bacterium]